MDPYECNDQVRGWQQLARDRLLGERLRGVESVLDPDNDPLPFPAGTFELVSSRHPVTVDWTEVSRVLAPGGSYLAQHVGPASAFELIEWFLGPLPVQRCSRARDPREAVRAAAAAGLHMAEMQTATCRMEFFDIGAVVYILRKCVWWVPGFTVDQYLEQLRALDAHIREKGAFVAYSSRLLIDFRRSNN